MLLVHAKLYNLNMLGLSMPKGFLDSHGADEQRRRNTEQLSGACQRDRLCDSTLSAGSTRKSAARPLRDEKVPQHGV